MVHLSVKIHKKLYRVTLKKQILLDLSKEQSARIKWLKSKLRMMTVKNTFKAIMHTTSADKR